ncbi:hypothetical protein TRFO_21580 [Tritrichomonas foetus]|uniref:Uncharacterized protein n=1 Tax=Tritrichomonas foetus TaxID=1144522 RepID=A0A1J4KEB3_9EUKA|nr:hypothetical protein TRFO_21580 [Tritrichomonas foetus]|eukprot:OHT09531.1 hypothetical protein TRFO_21580 [Tritrichomonas foetus]
MNILHFFLILLWQVVHLLGITIQLLSRSLKSYNKKAVWKRNAFRLSLAIIFVSILIVWYPIQTCNIFEFGNIQIISYCLIIVCCIVVSSSGDFPKQIVNSMIVLTTSCFLNLVFSTIKNYFRNDKESFISDFYEKIIIFYGSLFILGYLATFIKYKWIKYCYYLSFGSFFTLITIIMRYSGNLSYQILAAVLFIIVEYYIIGKTNGLIISTNSYIFFLINTLIVVILNDANYFSIVNFLLICATIMEVLSLDKLLHTLMKNREDNMIDLMSYAREALSL